MIKGRTYPIIRRTGTVAALAALIVTFASALAAPELASAAPPTRTAGPAAKPSDEDPLERVAKKPPVGKLNLNTATEDQLQLLPGIGPAKAERIVAWRKKNGGFKRVADLRKVKGFGYKTLRRLEPWLDVKGETTLAAP